MYFPFQYATVFTLLSNQLIGDFSKDKLFFTIFDQMLLTLPAKCSIPDSSTVSRWGNAVRPVSDDFVEYCKTADVHPLIENAIREKVLPHLADVPKLIYQIIKLVREDTDYTADARSQLLGYNPALENNHAGFLASALLAAIKINKCIRFDKEQLVRELYFPYKIPMSSRLQIARPFFTGRAKELADIETALINERIVFLYGARGIGKSALAAEYAHNTTQFCNCVWLTYDKNLRQTIESIQLRGDYPNSTHLAPFEFNFKWLRSLDHNTLVILDNFDVLEEEDPLFPDFIRNRFTLLVTSHVHHEIHFEYHMGDMNSQDLLSLFRHYYTRNNLSDTQISEIIQAAYHHTMVVEMTAKLMQNCPISFDVIIEELHKSVGNLSLPVNVLVNKDGRSHNAIIKAHLGALYDLSCLDSKQLLVLVCMSYMPANGIDTGMFSSWCNDPFCNTITSLTRLGWLERTQVSDILRMHPIVSESMHEQYTTYQKELTEFVQMASRMLNLNGYSADNHLQVAISICKYASDFQTTDWMIGILEIACYIHTKGLSKTSLGVIEQLISSEGYSLCPNYIKTFLNYRAGCLCILLNKYKGALTYFKKALSYDSGAEINEPAYCSLLINCLLECSLLYAIQDNQDISKNFLDYATHITQFLPAHEAMVFKSRSLFKTGEILRLQNKHSDARIAFQNSLELRDSLYGESSIESALAHAQMGLSYRKEQNNLKSAIEFYKAYSILKIKVPELHPDLVSVQLSLGITLENITGKDLGIAYLLDYLAGAAELAPSTKRTDVYVNILMEMLEHPDLFAALTNKSPEATEVIHNALASTKELFTKLAELAQTTMRDEYGWQRDYAPRNIAPTFFFPFAENKDENISIELLERLYDYHPKQGPWVEIHHYVGDSTYHPRNPKLIKNRLASGHTYDDIPSNTCWYDMLTTTT